MSSKTHNIIVVGNGLSLLESKRGSEIDSFDIVVRMGSYCLDGYEEYVGTKTDIFCTIANMFCKSSRDESALFALDPGMTSFNFKKILFLEYDNDDYYELTAHDNFWGSESIPVQPAAAGALYFEKLYSADRFKSTFKDCVLNDRIVLDYFIEHLRHVNNDVVIEFYSRLWRSGLFTDFNNIFPQMKIAVPSKGMYALDYILRTFKNSSVYVCGFDGFKTTNYWRPPGQSTYTFRCHQPAKELYMYKKLLREGIIHEL
jgi:hypothetical protein